MKTNRFMTFHRSENGKGTKAGRTDHVRKLSPRRLHLERLEDRALLAVMAGMEQGFLPEPTGETWVVTTLEDIIDASDGVLSLREALLGASENDTILFDGALTDGNHPEPTGATLVVTTLEDTVNASDGVLSLREALSSAAANDTITFDGSLAGGTITLSGTELTVNKAVTINASSLNGGITIDANRNSRIFNITENTRLINLTIQNGRVHEENGGGIYHKSGTLSMLNCVIQGNSAIYRTGNATYGGAIYSRGTLSMTNCDLVDNYSTSGGGAIYNAYSSLEMTNCSVTECRSDYGGVVDGDGGNITISGCELSNNNAKAFSLTFTETLTISDCSITDNRGTAIYLSYPTTVTISDCVIRGNNAEQATSLAGAFYNGGGTVTMTNCYIAENSSFHSGGIYNDFGTLDMVNCLVVWNYGDFGGGIDNSYGDLTMTNCTVAGNYASLGGNGILNDGTLILYNCIVAQNDGDDDIASEEEPVFGYNTLSSFTDWDASGSGNNYVYDPFDLLFTDQEECDYTLIRGSQAIDMGRNDFISDYDTDLAGNPRIVNQIVDLGAYEYQGGSLEPLDAPTITEVASYGANRHQVTWTAVEGATGYDLTYSSDQTNWTTVSAEGATSFVVTGLTYGDQVYYKVKALGDDSSTTDSDWSIEKSLYVCPMDINGDKIISGADLTALSKAYFSRPTSANWDSRADIDGSGMVNGSDLTWLSSNWLKRVTATDLSYPPEKALWSDVSEITDDSLDLDFVTAEAFDLNFDR